MRETYSKPVDRGTRQTCIAHPDRRAVALLTNTGDGLCKTCFRLLHHDPETLWDLLRAREERS